MSIERTGATAERLALAAEVARIRDSDHLTWRGIAERLDISRSYASELYNDPNGTKARARKDSYQGICARCGGPTTGSEGKGSARPEHCDTCAHAIQTEDKKWTRESVIDAIQRFATLNGRPPLAEEWIRSDPINGYPPRSAVFGIARGTWKPPFDKWADAIEAAGFPRPRVGQYVRRPRNHRREGMARTKRDFIILELDDDGRWIEHPAVTAYGEALAIEQFIETQAQLNGRAQHKYVAISIVRWNVRQLQPVTTFKAVAAA